MTETRMRRSLAAGSLLGLVTLVAGVLSAAALAAPGTDVAFVVDYQFSGPETIVSSSIPGCAAGSTVTDTSAQAAYDGPISLFSGTKLFDCGAAGTFTLSYTAHALACAPTDSGTWQVVAGTGMYAGMSGEGLVSGTYYGPDPAPTQESSTTTRARSGSRDLASSARPRTPRGGRQIAVEPRRACCRGSMVGRGMCWTRTSCSSAVAD